MTAEQLRTIQEWFHQYVDGFREPDGALHPMQELKLGHSLRVAAECRDLAADAGRAAGEICVVEAIGLLHDTGRFSQFREFRTFFDPKSVNHAVRGCEVLQSAGILGAVDPSGAHRVLEGVRCHNMKTIPPAMSADVLFGVEVVRDADKLDIFETVDARLRDGSFYRMPELMLQFDPEGPVNPVMLAAARNRQSAAYGEVRSLADFGLLRMSWTYDINTLGALRRVRERRMLERIREMMPSFPAADEVYAEVLKYLAERLGSGNGS